MSNLSEALKIEKKLGRIEKRRTERNALFDFERAQILIALKPDVRDALALAGVVTKEELAELGKVSQ